MQVQLDLNLLISQWLSTRPSLRITSTVRVDSRPFTFVILIHFKTTTPLTRRFLCQVQLTLNRYRLTPAHFNRALLLILTSCTHATRILSTRIHLHQLTTNTTLLISWIYNLTLYDATTTQLLNAFKFLFLACNINYSYV